MSKTLAQLAAELNKISPTRYSHFATAQAAPFICYTYDGKENVYADDDVLVEGILVTVELYTKTKDLAKEKEITAMFQKNKVENKDGPTVFLDTEGLFLTTFSVKLNN